MLDKEKENPIKDVWILHQESGICLVHRNYGHQETMDKSLFSGLITAIVMMTREMNPDSSKAESPIEKIQMPFFDLHYTIGLIFKCVARGVLFSTKPTTNQPIAAYIHRNLATAKLE